MDRVFRKSVRLFFGFFLGMLVIAGGITAFVDPFFHYHKPISGLNYNLHDERYQNYGIVNHFDYDAIITGTSMTENFRTSEFDAIFGVTSVKVPFSGGSHREVAELLDSAFDHNDNIKYVIRSVDLFRAFDKKDSLDYSEDSYPTYLNDTNPINDVKYLFNKQIFFEETVGVIRRTIGHSAVTTMDDYGAWWPYYTCGISAIQDAYHRDQVEPGLTEVSEEEYTDIRENMEANVIRLAQENPDTTFYLYIAPYSIYFFDYINEMGSLDRYLDAEEYIIRLFLEQDNIKIYSFFTEEEIICNPNNYRDVAHHNAEVNSQILQWMKEDHDLITKENCEEYFEKTRAFFHEYDYDSLFAEDGYTLLGE